MAPTINQIAGAVLEEAVLAVLGAAGFRPLTMLHGDPTIDPNGPPVTIHGRGTTHQIDAVADPLVGYAFTNPTRLLIEAKAYSSHRRVGLDIVRNAVGTAKDVSEFWRPSSHCNNAAKRYHYRYAIFSSSEFTRGAQEYAYAQDVYLLPLRRSAFFRPVIVAIESIKRFFEQLYEDDRQQNTVLGEYRRVVRQTLKEDYAPTDHYELIELHTAVQNVRHGLIAMADRQFPIFLVPRNPRIIAELDDIETIRIYWDNEGWYIRRRASNEDLFSFDLPTELFELYATGSNLEPNQALDLKAERLADLQAIVVLDNRVRLIQFNLDRPWIEALRGHQE